GCAELVLTQRWRGVSRIVEIVSGVEFVVPQELDGAAMNIITAGLRDDINERGCLASEFRGIQRLLNFELLNAVNRWTDHEIVEVLIRYLDAIQKINIVAAALTKHGR